MSEGSYLGTSEKIEEGAARVRAEGGGEPMVECQGLTAQPFPGTRTSAKSLEIPNAH